MLKTATLTWTSFYNYGTCLQAYALQHYIESLGYENYIIDDSTIIAANNAQETDKQKKGGWIYKWLKKWRKLQQSIHSNYRVFYKYQRFLCPSINHFKEKKLKICYDIESVVKDKADFDVFVCGSDQIWKPNGFENPKWSFYYAAFTNRPKIAYAPSIGAYQIPKKWKEKLSGLIAPFNALSVREEAGRMALQELIDQPVELVADPTLLLSRQEWESLLPNNLIKKEKYVLGYILTPNDTYYRIAKEYAHQHKMKFYLFMLNLQDYGQADKLISGGPFDFLEYVQNADMVFTDSFHGTIFSTIFEIPFFTFKRFSDDSSINQNSRIDTLLMNMGAEERMIDNQQNEPLNNDTLEFGEIKRRLEPLIEHSKKYLQAHLSAIEEKKGR